MIRTRGSTSRCGHGTVTDHEDLEVGDVCWQSDAKQRDGGSPERCRDAGGVSVKRERVGADHGHVERDDHV